MDEMSILFTILGSLIIIGICIYKITNIVFSYKSDKYMRQHDMQDKKIKELEIEREIKNHIIRIEELNLTKINMDRLNLSYSDIDDIINIRITEVWKLKYELYYNIRDVAIIKNMDNEIYKFTLEVLDTFSQSLKDNMLMYYSEEYLIQKITRQSQLLFIEYTNTHSPNGK